MKRCVVICLALSSALATADVADAQETTKSVAIKTAEKACKISGTAGPSVVPAKELCGCVPKVGAPQTLICTRPSDELSRLVDHDTTANLVTYLRLLVDAVVPSMPTFRQAIVRFVWIGRNADGKPTVRSVLYQDGDDETHETTLPGLTSTTTMSAGKRKYLDVLVGFAKDKNDQAALWELESLYTSSKTPSPVLEQVPAFVQGLGFLEAIAARGGVTIPPGGGRGMAPPGVPPAPADPPRAVLKVYGPVLPQKRAEIAVRDWIVTAPSVDQLTKSAGELAAELSLSAGRVSKCAANLATAYSTAIAAVSSCAAAKDLFSAEANACRLTLNAALDEAYELQMSPAKSALCPADTGSIGSDPVADVNDAFRDLVKQLGRTITQGELALKNTPRESISFGVMTAVRFGTPRFGGTRVGIGDDDNVKIDPLPRLVNAVVLNWHPLGYEPDRLATYKDKGSLTVSVGTALSPDFGVIVAGGWAPLKGLSLNVGYVCLAINAPRDGIVIGQPVPSDRPDLLEDPFRNRIARTWVWGLSYAFK